MSAWDIYQERALRRGTNRRDATLRREQSFLARKMPNSLSYHQLTIDGEPRSMAVINSDNLDQKTLCTLPGEDFRHGGLVHWMDNYWLITQRDANNEVYTRGTMRQCNYQLRWVADDGTIVERWCIVEDGTRYLTGDYSDRDFIVTRGDTRISVTLPRDEYTVKLNRRNRFLIDDWDSSSVLAYELTKPFKLGSSYGGNGVLAFVMQECNTEDSDNFELHIANYYDTFPRETAPEEPAAPDAKLPTESVPSGGKTEGGKKVWF